MKFGITSILWEDVGQRVSDRCVDIEDKFNLYFEGKDYGARIDVFLIILIAVDDDEVDNQRFAANNKMVGYAKDVKGKRSREIRISVSLKPSEMESCVKNDLKNFLFNNILETLSHSDKPWPKHFDYVGFVKDLTIAMDIYSTAE